MSRISDSVEVNVPVRTAYNQWTQFEEFPQFMEGVQRVEQLDDTTLRWTAEIAGKTKTWTARIADQQPDRRVAWQSTDGAPNNGTVTFEELGPERTRVHLELEVEPEGALESAGDALGFVERRVKGDLDRFKEFIESRGVETGGWRGEVQAGRTTSSGGMGGDAGGGMSGGSGGMSGGSGGMSGGSGGGMGDTGLTGSSSTLRDEPRR